ncbi:MAG: class I SAM-dependent methyltransferase [Verrucomicrobiota bacterium]
MNPVTKHNGNGAGRQVSHQPGKTAPAEMAVDDPRVQESLVTFQTADGLELQGVPARVTRHLVVFELYNPVVLQLSEVLSDLRIILRDRLIYAGRAVVRNVINAGSKVSCEASLNEAFWLDFDPGLVAQRDGQLTLEFNAFLGEWQKIYKVLPEFKVVIADMQMFLADLQIWLQQVELGIRSAPAGDRVEVEQQLARQLGQSVVPAFDALHERLEALSAQIDEDLRPGHRSFSKRQLHPFLLCSPFAYRAYHKPLGYAGDYEMVNMIGRNPCEGASLFAKIVNLWFLSQWPSKAHRNRLAYLAERLQTEALRVARTGRRQTRIYNFACGPAIELQNFMRDSQLSGQVEVTLADFSKEGLNYVQKAVSDLNRQFSRAASFQFQKKSVYQILKDGQKPVVSGGGPSQGYDLIYCAGLFDYLPDSTCKQLTSIFYDWLAPGGLLAVTNVVDNKPFRHMLEFVLDWHLIYRDAQRGASLLPQRVPADAKQVSSDATGVNVFIEARKPDHA